MKIFKTDEYKGSCEIQRLGKFKSFGCLTFYSEISHQQHRKCYPEGAHPQIRSLLYLWNAGMAGIKLIETIKQMTLLKTNVHIFMHDVKTVQRFQYTSWLFFFFWARNSASFLIHIVLVDICLVKYIFFPNALLFKQNCAPLESLLKVRGTE